MNFDNKLGVNGKIKLHWYDGKLKPDAVKRVDESFIKDARNSNCLFVVGTKATFAGTHYGTASRLTDREQMIEFKRNGNSGKKISPLKAPRPTQALRLDRLLHRRQRAGIIV